MFVSIWGKQGPITSPKFAQGKSLYRYNIYLVIRWDFFLSKQFQKSRSVLQDGSRFWDCFGRENPTNSQITTTDLILILGIFEEKPRSYSKNEYGYTEYEVSHSPVMQSSVGDKQNLGTFLDCTARQCSPFGRKFMECYIIKPAQLLLMKHLVIGQR